MEKMEGLSASLYKGVKGYLRRRKYERLNGATRRRKFTVVQQLGRTGDGGGTNRPRRRRFWKIKITPKLKLPRFSPKKFLIGLRDAYVNFMLRIADISPAVSGSYGGALDNSFAGFGKGPVKEYDDKMITQIYATRASITEEYDEKMIGRIYRSLMVAQEQSVHRDAARLGQQIVCGK